MSEHPIFTAGSLYVRVEEYDKLKAERDALWSQLQGERGSHLRQMDEWRIEKEMLFAQRDDLQAEAERLMIDRDVWEAKSRWYRARVEELEQALRGIAEGSNGEGDWTWHRVQEALHSDQQGGDR